MGIFLNQKGLLFRSDIRLNCRDQGETTALDPTSVTIHSLTKLTVVCLYPLQRNM